jgi:ribosomal protein S21
MSVTIYVGKNCNVDKAIKKLEKIMNKEGILSAYKQKLFFEKPCALKRRKEKKNLLKFKREQSGYENY